MEVFGWWGEVQEIRARNEKNQVDPKVPHLHRLILPNQGQSLDNK